MILSSKHSYHHLHALETSWNPPFIQYNIMLRNQEHTEKGHQTLSGTLSLQMEGGGRFCPLNNTQPLAVTNGPFSDLESLCVRTVQFQWQATTCKAQSLAWEPPLEALHTAPATSGHLVSRPSGGHVWASSTTETGYQRKSLNSFKTLNIVVFTFSNKQVSHQLLLKEGVVKKKVTYDCDCAWQTYTSWDMILWKQVAQKAQKMKFMNCTVVITPFHKYYMYVLAWIDFSWTKW